MNLTMESKEHVCANTGDLSPPRYIHMWFEEGRGSSMPFLSLRTGLFFLTHTASPSTLVQSWGMGINILILQMRKLRLREIKLLIPYFS